MSWLIFTAILVSLCTEIVSIPNAFNCTNIGNCECMPGNIEIQCPPKQNANNSLGIHLKDDGKKILIICFNLTTFNIGLLPNLTESKQYKTPTRIEIRNCPLPSRNLQEITRKFTDRLYQLEIESTDFSGMTFNKNVLNGLEMLIRLRLINTKLKYLDEDAFLSTPELLLIDLRGNAIEWRSNVFRNCKKLESLYIESNNYSFMPNDLFNGLQKLNALKYRFNNLTELSNISFANLKSLQHLELGANSIEELPDGIFDSLQELAIISLRNNNLSLISPDLFQHNLKLRQIRLGHNPLKEIPDYLFSNFTDLQFIEICSCQLKVVPENVFSDSKSLTKIDLSDNNLEEISPNLFSGLDKLRELKLNGNRIKMIKSYFTTLKSLVKLDLFNNSIESIEEESFSSLINLKEINLGKNYLSHIDSEIFLNNLELSVINLSNNKLISKEIGALFKGRNNFNLRKLNVSQNYLTDLDLDLLKDLRELQEINLSHNYIKQIKMDQFPGMMPKKIDLSYNRLITLGFSNVKPLTSTLILKNNSINCDCNSLEFYQFLQLSSGTHPISQRDLLTCSSPPHLDGIQIKNVDPNFLLCPIKDECPTQCSCYLRSFDKTFIVDCSKRNLTQIPNFNLPPITDRFNQTEVHLEWNNFVNGPIKGMTSFYNVTKLFLNNNQIASITWLPPKLQILDVSHNDLVNMDSSVLDLLNSEPLFEGWFSENPWSCDCQAEEFIKFLRNNLNRSDAHNVKCHNSATPLIDLNYYHLCQQPLILYLLLPLITFLISLSLLILLFLIYKQEIKVWLFAHNLFLRWVTEEDLDKDKQYDAFISFANQDENFVLETLMMHLESGSNPYKICIHNRDFCAGDLILTNIFNCVKNSKRTLLVLTNDYLKSTWAMTEFRTAYTNALEEKRNRIIIIMKGDLDLEETVFSVKELEELKMYLRTNTYLKWGEEHFWEKLIYALPHSVDRNVPKNNKKYKNILKNIESHYSNNKKRDNCEVNCDNVVKSDSGLLKKCHLNFFTRNKIKNEKSEVV